MKQDEYNFIRSLEGRSHVSHDEANRLKNIYASYVNPVRAVVLDPTCPPCVSEMYGSTIEYINKPDLKIE